MEELPPLLQKQSEIAGESIYGPPALPVVLDDTAEEDDDDLYDDEGTNTIDISYLKPNTTQKRVEAKLPLLAWVKEDKLLEHNYVIHLYR